MWCVLENDLGVCLVLMRPSLSDQSGVEGRNGSDTDSICLYLLAQLHVSVAIEPIYSVGLFFFFERWTQTIQY